MKQDALLLIALFTCTNLLAADSFPSSRNVHTWPFPGNSIWNMPIHKSAVYVDAQFQSPRKGTWIDEDVIITTPDEPLMNVYKTPYRWQTGTTPTTRCEKENNTVLFTLPIPEGYVTNFHASKANHASAVLMADGRTIRQSQPFQVCEGGYATTYFYGVPLMDIFTSDGIRGSHGGSGMSSIGGTILYGELMPDSGPIRHALKIDLAASINLFYDSQTKGYRWPAIRADGCAATCYGGSVKASRMGALVALKPEVDIDNWGLQTIPAKKIARAFQDYGGYVVDDAVQDVFTIITEEGPNRNVAAQFASQYGYPMKNNDLSHPWVKDMIKIFTNLYVVDNNESNSIGGGPNNDWANRRAPEAPPFGDGGGTTQLSHGIADPSHSASRTTVSPATVYDLQGRLIGRTSGRFAGGSLQGRNHGFSAGVHVVKDKAGIRRNIVQTGDEK